MKKTLGIYIHIPFCIKKCNYCDFCSFPSVNDTVKERYVDALCKEILSWSERASDRVVDTVYFGGGTPTLLTASQLGKIIGTVKDSFCVSESAEITTECNPATADLEYFRELKKLGFNRISLGVQSANDRELSLLGRLHSFADAKKAFYDARQAGFDNISVDLMFSIPEQTEESFKHTLDEIFEMSPDHISAYSLIVEPGTPFFANYKKLVLPDEDTEYNMYTGAVEAMERHGLHRYEISNFAATGRESRHNLKYWRCEEYLGFGISAHSFFDDERRENTSELDVYINGAYTAASRKILPNEAVNEYVMLKMRLSEGIDESEFEKLFGIEFGKAFGEALERFVCAGLVVREGGRCAFTDSGFYLSNTVLSEILSFEDE